MADEPDRIGAAIAEPLQPAQHDKPEGPGLSWDARDFSDEELVGNSQTEADTELVADGDQEADDSQEAEG
jgi:hypothetical protein